MLDGAWRLRRPVVDARSSQARAQTLVPGGSRLSEGAIIRATVRARVFGLNLIRLEARIEAAPAQLQRIERLLRPQISSAPVGPAPRPPQGLGRSVNQLQRPGPAPTQVVGSRLNEAMDLLNQGAASLAAANENRTVTQ